MATARKKQPRRSDRQIAKINLEFCKFYLILSCIDSLLLVLQIGWATYFKAGVTPFEKGLYGSTAITCWLSFLFLRWLGNPASSHNVDLSDSFIGDFFKDVIIWNLAVHSLTMVTIYAWILWIFVPARFLFVAYNALVVPWKSANQLVDTSDSPQKGKIRKKT
ncbi:hypothetical protein ACOME3_002275 [Neoechinorhynchus agilis]